ncbi:hypothetical protein JXD38_03415 [candidate division WOR-3 bacterium]|nr:hypothetical protein [candidate division WOR-3 bacterium]
MKIWHRELAAGRWFELSYDEQMGNVGSEVERALNWQQRGNSEYCRRAVERAFELLDLTIADARNSGRHSELTRLREALADYFVGENQLGFTPARWRSYFLTFALAARAGR